jgi:ribosomal protein S18 acetylase RimI-like enzyme
VGKARAAAAVAQDVAHPLDNPLWAALTGPQAHLAERRGRAARFPVDVTPFAATDGSTPHNGAGDETAWADLAALVGAGGVAVVPGAPAQAPPGWEPVGAIPGVQMDGSGLGPAPDPEAVVLGPADVPAMLDLVARTRPGPFLARTLELGTYLGIRRGGALVAMAGERMHPPGWTEISAVCTDPAHRGQGLAGRLVRAVAVGIRERGDVPFLHAAADNHAGIRLYERLGFTHRRDILFAAMQAAQRSASNSDAIAAQWRSSAARS